jgi:hypothetical protein
MWYLYTIKFYSATKKNEILSFVGPGYVTHKSNWHVLLSVLNVLCDRTKVMLRRNHKDRAKEDWEDLCYLCLKDPARESGINLS